MEDQEMCQNKLEVVDDADLPIDAVWRSPEIGQSHCAWSFIAGSSVFRGAKSSVRDEMTQVTKTFLAESSRTKYNLWLHQLYSKELYQLNLVLHFSKFACSHL